MVDRERVLAKLDQLRGYVDELRTIQPVNLGEFRQTEKRRATERLLQISIEAVLDICHLLVSGLRLGIPAEEDDVLTKLDHAGILSPHMVGTLRRMKGLRNILVHDYGRTDERIVYEMASSQLGDFSDFSREALAALHRA